MNIKNRKTVYIAHPMTGKSGDKSVNFEKNKKLVVKICEHMMEDIMGEERKIIRLNKIISSCKDTNKIDRAVSELSIWSKMIESGCVAPWFFAPQIYISNFINETKSSSKEMFDFMRGIAIEFCLSFIDIVDGIYVYKPSELSRGVMDDIERTAEKGKFIKFMEKYPWEE